jgi:predicted dinucleotide-binding enzyme
MDIACIGIGNVGAGLASSLIGAGHNVVVAARDTGSVSVEAARRKIPQLVVEPLEQAVAQAEVVLLATPFDANEMALQSAGSLDGKIVVDCTNPVGAGLVHGLANKQSGGEYVQSLVPGALVVKAFTVYGFENFEDSLYPGYGNLKPAMFIAGNDAGAKAAVSSLCVDLGWEPIDTGDISMSLHLEHMALLWIKMCRQQGRGLDFVWACLRR